MQQNLFHLMKKEAEEDLQRTKAGGLMCRFYMYLLNKTPYYAKINFIALIGLKA